MSFGMRTIRQLREMEKLAHDLGLKFVNDPYDSSGLTIALSPRDDELPDYARDAVMFTADFDHITTFLRGMAWQKQYFQTILKLASHDQVHRKEQDRRNKQLLEKLKA